MRTFKQFINEAKGGLSDSDKKAIAKAVAEDIADGADEDVNELIGMYLENYSGGEMAGAKEIKEIAKLVQKHQK